MSRVCWIAMATLVVLAVLAVVAPRAALAEEKEEKAPVEKLPKAIVTIVNALFPEGTGGHPSEALPEVWTQWDKFTKDADALGVAAKDLVAALEGGAPDWKAKFKGGIDACKTCHKTFRTEDD